MYMYKYMHTHIYRTYIHAYIFNSNSHQFEREWNKRGVGVRMGKKPRDVIIF